MKPKFEIGDILRVVRRSGFIDDGSKIRDNFIVNEIDAYDNDNGKGFVYFPNDGNQGAYEHQLEYQQIKNWKEKMKNDEKDDI